MTSKLEARLFTDYSEQGSLFAILDKLCQIKAQDDGARDESSGGRRR